MELNHKLWFSGSVAHKDRGTVGTRQQASRNVESNHRLLSGRSGCSYGEVMDLKKEKIELAGIWSLTTGPVDEAAKICTLKNVRICGTSATILFSSKMHPHSPQSYPLLEQYEDEYRYSLYSGSRRIFRALKLKRDPKASVSRTSMNLNASSQQR